MAALHARCFATRPWTADEFAQLIQADRTIWIAGHDHDGLIVAQYVPPEAELLIVAVVPEARRRGIARGLIDGLISALPSVKVSDLFLEVAADNTAARALYASCGFAEAGRRKGYYQRPESPAADALILRKTLP